MDLEKLRARFDIKYEIERGTGCWLWTASTAGLGYGQIKIPGERRQIYAHRLSYLLHKGEIPEGLVICHHCDVPRCVNPAHLFLGTSRDNSEDMSKKGRGTKGWEMPTHAGVNNSQAKLSEKQVREILGLLARGVPQAQIGRYFGITGAQVCHIAHGRSWKHLGQSLPGAGG